MNAIEIRHVSKTFGTHRAVSELTLDVPGGAIYGFLVPDTGTITVLGRPSRSTVRDDAACSDLKDSQSMMQPIMIFLLLPVVAVPVIVGAPHSTLAVVLSLIPTATPFLMLVRLAMTPPPPMWQVPLSLILTALTTAGLVWAAGRIFRAGLLMQGKPPDLPELLRWIRQ